MCACLAFCCLNSCAPQRNALLSRLSRAYYRLRRLLRGRVGHGSMKVLPTQQSEGAVFALSHSVGKAGAPSAKRGEFAAPCGACEMREPGTERSLILVADTNNHRLELVSVDGEPIGKEGGSYGTLPGQYDSPQAVIRDEEAIFVCDTANNRLQKIGGNRLPGFPQCAARDCGTFHSLQGKKPRKPLEAPAALALHGDIVYVADAHCRIMAFDTGDLVPRYEIGRSGTADAQFGGPVSSLATYAGELYACDSGNHRVQVFACEQRGKFVRALGEHGRAAGQFHRPRALAAHGDVLFVVDDAGERDGTPRSRIQALRLSDDSALGEYILTGLVTHLHVSAPLANAPPQMLAADAHNHVVHVFHLRGLAAQRGRAKPGVARLNRAATRILAAQRLSVDRSVRTATERYAPEGQLSQPRPSSGHRARPAA